MFAGIPSPDRAPPLPRAGMPACPSRPTTASRLDRAGTPGARPLSCLPRQEETTVRLASVLRRLPSRVRPRLELLEDRTAPAVVGYYDTFLGAGDPKQAVPITTAGHTAVKLNDLTVADLAGIDVLFVQNQDNFAYGAEFLSRLPSVWAAVNAGATLVLHDRFVDLAETVLPGGAGFNIVRSFADPSNINILDPTTVLTNGPGGVVTNTNLDGARFSSHGWAVASSLPT